MSPTQKRTLRHMQRTGECVYTVSTTSGTCISNAVRGTKQATLFALVRMGLIVCKYSNCRRESVPAGPFGRTLNYGYRSVLVCEASYSLTQKGADHDTGPVA